jgi:cytochrome c oxidase cbb3-type subunit 1
MSAVLEVLSELLPHRPPEGSRIRKSVVIGAMSNHDASVWRRRLQCMTAMYSLLWLLAANLVGLWLAAALLWPDLGKLAGEFTYGRWMPLHMDWQLYGWCSLPLVGLLMGYFLCEDDGADAHLGFILWSVALGVAGVLSLNGVVSGKLFLNWAGLGRMAFPVAQLVLWAILLRASVARWRRIGKPDTKQWIQAGLLLVLLVSPFSLFWTAGADVYPPIDPESGGATGHSLLASSLGILAIFGMLPIMLRMSLRKTATPWRRIYLGCFVLSVGAWALLGHGNASNTELSQVFGLGVLLLWVPLLWGYYRAHDWPAPLRPWLGAFLFWWGFLTVSGFISFLPGVLDLMKFTNGLVAHAHLAMAGMVGAFNMLVLGSLGEAKARDPWADGAAFLLWQLGTLIYVLSMLVQGVREGLDPTVLFGANTVTSILYSIRLFAGVLLLAANLRWLWKLERVRSLSGQNVQALARSDYTSISYEISY